MREQSTNAGERVSGGARVMPMTTEGGQRYTHTHSSWAGGRSLEAELEYQSTLAGLSLVDEPEPVVVGHDGRYAIRRLIGRGAMGAVYFADDLALRRCVAIKVVSKIVGDREHFQDRLRREAWALALLDHPNVLQVYDVDLAASGELFIVMQYVAGQNLREWVESCEPSRVEILEVFAAAARGLAAAHAKGLVHRDFKPDNVLIQQVEGQRRVLVADFGLAGGAVLESVAANSSREGAPELDTLPVQTARFLGTPAYMSPEQRRCEALDGRSDQFAFCVSMWELLLGERPLGALVERRPLDLPTWLYALLRRGLAAKPGDRHADMLALLDALEHAPARRKRWFSLGAAALLGGALATTFAVATRPDATSTAALAAPDPCADVVGPLDGIWNGARKLELERHLGGLELDGASELATRTSTLLERAAERWRVDRLDRCEAAPQVESRCHARWLDRFDRRVALLGQLDAGEAGAVMALVEPLLSNSLCTAPPAPLDPAIQATLDQAEDAELLADFDTALALSEQAHAQASALADCGSTSGYSLERGAAAYRIGHIHGERHEGARALEWLQTAQRQARACEDDARLLEAQLRSVKIHAIDLARVEHAGALLLDAESLAARSGPRSSELDWELALTRGLVDLARGQASEAQVHFRAALALPDASTRPLRATEALINLGVAHYEQGQHAQAQDSFDAAADRIRGLYGSWPPELDLLTFNRATLLAGADEDEQARISFEQAAQSPHVSVRLSAETALLRLFYKTQDLDSMRAHAIDLLALVRANPGQPALDRARALYWVGQIKANDGEAAGFDALREALASFEHLAPQLAERDDCELSLAWNLLERGQLEQAQIHAQALASRDLHQGAAAQFPQFELELQEKLSAR